jgi:hypothetical protein
MEKSFFFLKKYNKLKIKNCKNLKKLKKIKLKIQIEKKNNLFTPFFHPNNVSDLIEKEYVGLD